jgi:hypothetical protein
MRESAPSKVELGTPTGDSWTGTWAKVPSAKLPNCLALNSIDTI